MLVFADERRYGIAFGNGFPSHELKSAAKQLKGTVLTSSRNADLLLGVRFDGEGRATVKGVSVDYSVDGRRYRSKPSHESLILCASGCR